MANAGYIIAAYGITAIVDHQGRMVVRLPRFEQDVLEGSALVMEGRTLYSRLGGMPVLVGCFSILIIGFWLRRRVVREDTGQAGSE